MTAKYGTDALRFALVFNTAPGTDMAMSDDKIKGMKHFANKLWNIARFILSSTENVVSPFMGSPKDITANKSANYTEADRDILSKLDAVTKSSSEHLENFHLHEAAQEIYNFVWKEFADVYVEASKKQLADDMLKKNTENILYLLLTTSLKLLHPLCPL